MKDLVGFRSMSAVRLFELLCSFSSMRDEVLFSITDLRRYLGSSSDSYYKNGDFFTKVVVRGVKEINRVTGMVLSCDRIKEGRVCTGVRFSFLFGLSE